MVYDKLILVGMPGSGKTTLGRLLSKKLNIDFFDLDGLIELKSQESISDIFNIHGETYFRKVESEILLDFLSNHKKYILSAGGGTPCYFNNMALMKSHAQTIYLNVSAKELLKRLSRDAANRPLLYVGDLGEKIVELVNHRNSFYEQADYIISGDSINYADILAVLKHQS